MALSYTMNVPTADETGVTIPAFDRTNLVLVDSKQEVNSKGHDVRSSVYQLAEGDKNLPTTITVRCTVRPATSAEPYGSASYSVRLDTKVDVYDSVAAANIATGLNLNMTHSWNIGGMGMADEASLFEAALAVSSLLWSSVAVGVPQPGVFTNLAYEITSVYS